METVDGEFVPDDREEDVAMGGEDDYEDDLYEVKVRNSVIHSCSVLITCHREFKIVIAT